MKIAQPTIPFPLKLYPYQKAWIDDESRFRVATKSRRIGFSFAAGLDGVLDSLTRKQKFIVLSRGERQSVEFINESVIPHVEAIGVAKQLVREQLPESSVYAQKVVFDNGSEILAFPANPDTARSYEGNILLDEFAFHQKPQEIWRAIAPSITRGYRISVISTPNGQQGSYWELAQKAGLADEPATDTQWSAHKVDIHQAIAAGFADRDGKPIRVEDCRAICLDDDDFLQEYCCVFLSIALQWISPELFQRNVSDEAAYGYPALHYQNLYAGWDVARNKDLSVIWFMEKVGDVSVTRGVIEFRNVPTPTQLDEMNALMPRVLRLVIDKGAMGLTIFEQLYEKHGYTVEGVQFTLPVKEALAVHAKQRMERTLCRIPDETIVRQSFRSVKKMTTMTGQARFDAEHDAQSGHADHYWAFCLAESAASMPRNWAATMAQEQREAETVAHNHDTVRELAMAQRDEADLPESLTRVTQNEFQKPATNAKTPSCPACGSKVLRIYAETMACNCGWTGERKR